MNNKNIIDKDNLILTAAAIDDMSFIIGELMNNFFEYNPEKEKDIFKICYEFKRYRAYTDILIRLINDVKKDLDKNGITSY